MIVPIYHYSNSDSGILQNLRPQVPLKYTHSLTGHMTVDRAKIHDIIDLQKQIGATLKTLHKISHGVAATI